MIKILFISIDARTILALSEVFQDISDVTCTIDNIKNLKYEPNTMFVSPANSIGFMNGGLDQGYMDMFSGIQKKVQDKIRILGKQTALGRYYLPIGSALVVPVKNNCTLVSTPTMFLPHDVSNTRNAYYAMMAALMAFRKVQLHTIEKPQLLVSTGLCCGYGKMDPLVSAKQMREAYDDFLNGNIPIETEKIEDPYYVITQDHNDEQPMNYDNRELREIIV